MELYPHIKPYLSDVERVMESGLMMEDRRVYHLLLPFIKRGGKRIRPALTLLSCGVSGGKYSSVVEAAAIIELFHNFTLIHDDIEDNSQFRRGEPTLHISHGIPLALNSGDALYTFLWKKLIILDLSPPKLIKLQKLYAESFKRVVDGQGIELSWIRDSRFDVSENEYLEMIRGKTSALIGLSCEAGALLAGADSKTRKTLREYGETIGTAFQIQDDILNLTGNFEIYKKEIGGDITEGKRTLMVVHALANSTSQDKKTLITILASGSKNKRDIEAAIEIIKRCGSVDYASSKALNLVNHAKNLLKKIPDSDDKQSLLYITDYVIKREE
jgi:geranylgeranyl diphosphate synthase type I